MDAIYALLLTFVPWVELRGSIPVSIAAGLDPIFTLVAAIILNIVVFFPIWIVLSLAYRYVKNWRFFRWAAQKALKHRATVDRWGVPGLAIFVAIPLPFTGAWTATLLAWLLQVKWQKAFIAIAVGAVAAGLIVYALSMGVLGGLKLFF